MSYRKTLNSYDGVGNGNDSVVHVPVCTYSPAPEGVTPVKCTKLPDGCPLTTGCIAGASKIISSYFPTLCTGSDSGVGSGCACGNWAWGNSQKAYTMIPADILRQGPPDDLPSVQPSEGRNPTVTYVSNKLALLPRISPYGNCASSPVPLPPDRSPSCSPTTDPPYYNCPYCNAISPQNKNDHQFWCYVADKSRGNSSDCKQYLASSGGCGDGKIYIYEGRPIKLCRICRSTRIGVQSCYTFFRQ